MELLAPAGNYESFLGAIHAGADAVYLGGNKFGARAYADNFSEEEICRAISYAHIFGKKVYLTVNTLIKDSELPELLPYLTPFYQAGLDGVIVQDIGALLTIRDAFPDLELHASTQMTLTGIHGVEFLKELGVVRIVPARELSLEEIKDIKEQTGLSIETFIHGAMCYCYSGQCLFSSILGGRSGNRGRCAQPCRLPYQVGNTHAYPLSLKDMCTISLLPELIEAGIDSFKIEGRMKKPEYAAGVTAIYRKYIDLYYEKGAVGYKVLKEDLEKLSSLYIRSQIQDGYYFKHNGRDMVTLESPSYSGSDETLLQTIRDTYLTTPLKKNITIQAVFEIGKEAKLTLICDDTKITAYGQEVQAAAKQPVTRKNIVDGLSKLGNTPFTVTEDEVFLFMDDNVFYPLKAVNELRRSAVNLLLAAFVPAGRTVSAKSVEKSCATPAYKALPAAKRYRILISTNEQLHAFMQSGIQAEILYLESNLLKEADILSACRNHFRKQNAQTQIYIALPYILRKKDYPKIETMFPILQKADGVLVRNTESYFFLQKKHYEKHICTDTGVYVFNQKTLSFWLTKVSGCCLPYELNKKELRKLLENVDNSRTEQVAFGKIPLMVTANCVAKTCGANTCGQSMIFHLTDRYHKQFPVFTDCDFCYNIIYNTVPVSLHEKVTDYSYPGAWRLAFTVESSQETQSVLRFFDALQKGMEQTPPYAEYTLGHEKRGVE